MQIKTVIAGLGNVGRRLLELLEIKRETLRERYDLEFVIIAAADSSGSKPFPGGIRPGELVSLKKQGKRVADDSTSVDPVELIRSVNADLLVELTPTNLLNGEPGLGMMRTALGRGIQVVTANKGPLVLAYEELTELARSHGAKLLHSATVTGGLPTLNIGRRDLGACDIIGFEGIVNATTNYILSRMSEGDSFESALKHAQEVGHAEADPTLDVDGWDAANKLVIIANAVLRRPTKLEQVNVVGIRGVTEGALREARSNNKVIKLVAKAKKKENGGRDFEFSVMPTLLPADHPLARVNGDMMGVIYQTDINGTIFASIEEKDPYPTAAAVLRDMVDVYR